MDARKRHGVQSMIRKCWKNWPRTNHPECNDDSINGKPAVHFHYTAELLLHYSTAIFPPGILTKATGSSGYCYSTRNRKRKRKDVFRSPHKLYEIYTDAVDFASHKGILLARSERKKRKVMDEILERNKS